ncbi:hypothetical protein IE53DRAFT_319658 [Violaceomyces palustris]|uniref:Uncharacterized protein n=1 Tax=Violaceomyces palustris TaxID=1673888 RepID=A0ACD0NR71_9BASI|nr:hypothetical protein IE53DRAFT_319658 [Violaceomyces palustris]
MSGKSRALDSGEKGRNDEEPDWKSDRADVDSVRPPSFAESQFATIIRRQRKRRVFSPTNGFGGPSVPDMEADGAAASTKHGQESSTSDAEFGAGGGHKGLQLKAGGASAFPPDRDDPLMAAHQAWEFAGWGSISLLELTPTDTKPLTDGVESVIKPPTLGQWKASAIAGNAVTGSIFYAIPAVVAVSSVLSPISILLACLLLYPFRPIICELASALSASNAGNYSYLSNVSTKSVSLLAAAITMLDAISTGAVSARTASAYISAEAASEGGKSLISSNAITVLLLLGLSIVCLSGLRDSSSLALVMLALHVSTMVALILAGIVSWARQGNSLLAENWRVGMASFSSSALTGGKSVARAIFDGTCVAFVGLTGIECTPSYVNQVKDGQFPKALRNLQIIIILTEAPLMLLVLANVPLKDVLGGSNVLSLLGNVAGKGEWLKVFVVIDAAIVLCGGIMTGIIAFCGLAEALSDDLVLPSAFKKLLPKTGAAYVSISVFLALSLVMCASCGFSLSTLSSVFSVSFLAVMTLFGVALLLLKHARPTLPREPRSGLCVVFSGVCVGITALAGNLALSPIIILQTFVYFIALTIVLLVLANRVALAKLAVWLADQSGWVHSHKLTAGLNKTIIHWIRRQRKPPVIYFTKTDDISVLVSSLCYIKENEQTSNCKLVHCYKSIEEIPEQLDETFQLVDEIFPTITVDLVFVEAPFTPHVADAIGRKLSVPRSRCFISCPNNRGVVSGSSTHKLADYGGLRIILP